MKSGGRDSERKNKTLNEKPETPLLHVRKDRKYIDKVR